MLVVKSSRGTQENYRLARPAQTDVSRTLDIIVVAMLVIVDESKDESSALWSTLPLLMSALTSSRILN